ncbi:MAG: hypothetical protein IJR99_05890 [Kiritimatiellae bacterium]|nr:hypothetical protein [Kiritimatiellia bacterium]
MGNRGELEDFFRGFGALSDKRGMTPSQAAALFMRYLAYEKDLKDGKSLDDSGWMFSKWNLPPGFSSGGPTTVKIPDDYVECAEFWNKSSDGRVRVSEQGIRYIKCNWDFFGKYCETCDSAGDNS